VKVAFVLGTTTGGTGRHVRTLAAGCATRGVAAEVFGPAQTDRDFGFSGVAGVGFTEVHLADRPRVLRDLRAIARLRRLLAAWRPDVVHAHGLRAGALAAIATAFVRPTVYRARPALVVTVHNAPGAGGLTGAIYRVLELIVARRADSVLCVSPDLEARMRAAGARRVGHAVVPAVSRDLPADVSAQTRPAPGAGALAGTGVRRPVVLAVGRLAPQKGFTTLLNAAARWRDLAPEPVLAIVGEGPLEAQLKHQAAELGLAVQFTGSRRDVPALLGSADVFVLPSLWEGQPLIVQEALRAGVPVVATRVGGTPELTGEDAALLVPPGDPARLAAAVRSVLTDPGLAARLREAAGQRARLLPGEDDAVTAALAEYRLANNSSGRLRRRGPRGTVAARPMNAYQNTITGGALAH
jgi:glycosyltransferase involved in cell wall biosynthesis